MKTTVKEASQCPSCGKPMPAGAPLAGLCPACLLAQGAETDAGGGGRFEPPPLVEVAKLFPQLEILDLLGAGGMGAVYKARQPALDRIVALKILPSQNARGANFAERFNREARALAKLSHPNIVAVHEFGQAGALSYFIMEFVDGANLRMLEQGSRLSPREALQLIPQICDALQYAHDEGVVHRDIKPENVLVDRKGRVKIADFGLAKILGVDTDALRLTAEGQVMGTPHYMAPEQIEKPLSVDHRADIYALGVVFYEMLTGDLPLGKFSPPSRKVQVDVRFDDVVLRALENDPARRYQHASEVKTQVENIAGTPAPLIPAPAPEGKFLRWAGFPVVVERNGARRVNRKEALKAFGILFGVLTIGFGLVSLVTGRTWFGWLGISGSLSLQLRLLIAAMVTAFGVWRAWRSKPAAARPLPQTPQGTVILPPEKFSRKAVIGACWAPLFVIAALLYFLVSEVTTEWWQILLGITLLPLGLAAPFGTTILGWIAVGDIRRARGRISGLPLAVFDGLFFPLLALDGFLIWAWMAIVSGLHGQAVFEPFHAGEVSVLTKLGAASICVMVDLWIIRRVWRAAQLNDGASVNPWWSTRRGAMAIGLTCALIIAAVSQRRGKPPDIFKNPPQQIATRETATGALVAHLPGGGIVELLAVAAGGTAPNDWWQPDGRPIPDALFEIPDAFRAQKGMEFVVRFRDLPPEVTGPSLRIDPIASAFGGRQVVSGGKVLDGGWGVSAIFLDAPRTATLSLGFGLGGWQTVSTHMTNGQPRSRTMPLNLPDLGVRIHQVTESAGQTVVTVLVGRESEDWNSRVIAVDTNGVEHPHLRATSTPTDKASVRTYTFRKLALAQVKEFRAQVEPVHWVEFREIALTPRSRVGKNTRPFKAAAFGETKEVQFADLFDFDRGLPGVFPTASARAEFFSRIVREPSWIRDHGFDVVAGTNELLMVDTQIKEVANAEWETLSPVPLNLTGLFANGAYWSLLSSPHQVPRSRAATLPVTYAFQTRGGAIGLFQILGFSEQQPGVRLRYKIVEPAHFE